MKLMKKIKVVVLGLKHKLGFYKMTTRGDLLKALTFYSILLYLASLL